MIFSSILLSFFLIKNLSFRDAAQLTSAMALPSKTLPG